MAGGLAALLDDVAALARAAAASTDDIAAAAGRASVKATGVVVDDAAVTPQYVRGIEPKRELPIIGRIAVGSLRNKLLIILPVALLLSAFAPWLLTPILMLGGTYLCFEGAEKVWELVSGHGHGEAEHADDTDGADAGVREKRIISGAVRTDLILSAEIMVIALNDVASEPLLKRALILIVVGLVMTVLVYGAVALLVKMDDVGLSMTRRRSGTSQTIGRGLVAAMPKVMTLISWIGMVAMLWVGGHILLDGSHKLGLAQPYGLVHDLVHAVHGAGGAVEWIVGTLCSAVVGLLIGAAIVAVVSTIRAGRAKH